MGSGEVAGTMVMTTVGQASPAIRALGAVMMMVLAGLLWCGIGRAVPALVGIALVLLVLPGVSGFFETVCLMVALTAGTLPLLLDGGLDYLTGRGIAR
jgi:hypothetical protein